MTMGYISIIELIKSRYIWGKQRMKKFKNISIKC